MFRDTPGIDAYERVIVQFHAIWHDLKRPTTAAMASHRACYNDKLDVLPYEASHQHQQCQGKEYPIHLLIQVGDAHECREEI